MQKCPNELWDTWNSLLSQAFLAAEASAAVSVCSVKPGVLARRAARVERPLSRKPKAPSGRRTAASRVVQQVLRVALQSADQSV